MAKTTKGKFIVIDGIDGSGKTMQVSFLINNLRKNGYKVGVLDFPQYYTSFFGKMVGEQLTGKFGKVEDISPYLSSLSFALDRFSAKEKIKKWLKEGRIVVTNRYTSANQIHQGGRFKNSKQRGEFLRWLEELEFQVLRIPKPDRIVFLRVPVPIARKLILKKAERGYTGKKKRDGHEKSITHLTNALAMGTQLARQSKNWTMIDCVSNDDILPPEVISQKVWNVVEKFLVAKS